MSQEVHPLVGAVAALHRVLDGMPAGAWAGLEPALVRTLVTELARVETRVQAQKLHAARRLEATGEANRAGASSTGALLAGDFGGDRRSNDQLVTLGKNLDPVSHTQAALDAGDITLGQSRVIADAVGKAPVEHRGAAEAGMLASAPDLTLKDLRRRGDRIADTWAEPEHVDQSENDILVERERRARANTRFRMWDNTNGTHSGEFTLPDLEAEMLKAAVEAIAAPRRDHLKYGCQTDPEATNDLPADYPHRLGLAFADLCSHFQTDGLPQAGGTGATLIVRLDQKTLTEGIRASTLSSGTRLSASQTRKLACRVGIIPEIWGGASLPLDQGPEARFFNRTQRRALAARDGGCSFPGCDRPPQMEPSHKARSGDGVRSPPPDTPQRQTGQPVVQRRPALHVPPPRRARPGLAAPQSRRRDHRMATTRQHPMAKKSPMAGGDVRCWFRASQARTSTSGNRDQHAPQPAGGT